MKNIYTLIIFALLLNIHAQAQPGQLDKTFGQDGKVIIGKEFPDMAHCMILDKNNKILIGGETSDSYVGINTQFVVYRLNEDGSFDQTFGGFDNRGYKGRSIVPAAYNGGSVEALALQEDGKILAAGWMREPQTCKTMIVVRLNTDGSVDETFGNKGIAKYYCFGNDNYSYSVKDIFVQADGKILTTSCMSSGVSDAILLAIRMNQDGSMDKEYGNDHEYGAFLLQNVFVYDSELLANGKLMISGVNYENDFIFFLNEYGAIDQSYGEGGWFKSVVDERPFYTLGHDSSNYWGIGPPRDYKIGLNSGNEVKNLNPDGSLNTNFSNDGILLYPIFINGVVPEVKYIGHDYSRRKILFVGSTYKGSGGFKCENLTDPSSCVNILTETNTRDFYIMRVNEDGTPDETFSEYGSKVIPISLEKEDVANAALLDNKGRVLMAGYINNGVGSANSYDIVIARVLQEDINTSVNPSESAIDFSVYPNPANGLFHVNAKLIEQGTLTVFDPVGRVVSRQTLSEVSDIDLSGEPAGMYIIEITGKNSSGKKLIVKQ